MVRGWDTGTCSSAAQPPQRCVQFSTPPPRRQEHSAFVLLRGVGHGAREQFADCEVRRRRGDEFLLVQGGQLGSPSWALPSALPHSTSAVQTCQGVGLQTHVPRLMFCSAGGAPRVSVVGAVLREAVWWRVVDASSVTGPSSAHHPAISSRENNRGSSYR